MAKSRRPPSHLLPFDSPGFRPYTGSLRKLPPAELARFDRAMAVLLEAKDRFWFAADDGVFRSKLISLSQDPLTGKSRRRPGRPRRGDAPDLTPAKIRELIDKHGLSERDVARRFTALLGVKINHRMIGRLLRPAAAGPRQEKK